MSAKPNSITLAELRADLDARRPYAKAVMEAFRRNDIAGCAEAQRIMREKFADKEDASQ